ncbi:hypothetical protein GCM10020220_010720 [Nonomuraea rubra]
MLPPNVATPNGMSRAVREALASRYTPSAASSARVAGARRTTRSPSRTAAPTEPVTPAPPSGPFLTVPDEVAGTGEVRAMDVADRRPAAAAAATTASTPDVANSSPPSGGPASPTTPVVTALTAFALVRVGPVPTTEGICARAAGRKNTDATPCPRTAT